MFSYTNSIKLHNNYISICRMIILKNFQYLNIIIIFSNCKIIAIQSERHNSNLSKLISDMIMIIIIFDLIIIKDMCCFVFYNNNEYKIITMIHNHNTNILSCHYSFYTYSFLPHLWRCTAVCPCIICGQYNIIYIAYAIAMCANFLYRFLNLVQPFRP